MNKRLAVVGVVVVAMGAFGFYGCAVSTHATRPSALGTARTSAELLAVVDQPGPVTVETVASADWKIDRSGLINLDSPKAKAAGLKDGLEPIHVYFHVVRHPTRGTFIIDTGVEKALRDDRDKAAVRGPIAAFMKLEEMTFPMPLSEWVAKNGAPAGVFLTHLHLDHITGMADVPNSAVVYTGPGEAAARSPLNAFVQGSTDRALEGKAELQEWPYTVDPKGPFHGVVDVFGDGSVWAVWVPGHTPGSTAYVVRTPNGPVLFTGDAVHTRWGWDNDVESGTFNGDMEGAKKSLAVLRTFAAQHPALEVRLGHQ